MWSLAYGALGLYWALGGAGFPFAGVRTEAWMSPLAGVAAAPGGALIAALGLAGAIVALAMSQAWGRGLVRLTLIGFGLAASLTLLLVVPDTRLLSIVGYLPALIFSLGVDAVDWPIVNQAVCLAGGFAWGAATLAYYQATRSAADHGRETRTTAVTSASPAPAWGRWATIVAVLLPLPYAITRLAWAAGYPLGISDPAMAAWATDPAVRVIELSLGGMALGGALLTLGLIQRWGEVVPGWVPVLAGRRVPPAVAVVPAAIASAVLIAGGLGLWRTVISQGLANPGDVPALATVLAFLPWGITLALATLAYVERRRAQRAAQSALA
jgi:hypothetical protein